MKKIIAIFFGAFFCLSIPAQIETLHLDNSPKIAELTDAEKKEVAIVLIDHRIIEYSFPTQGERAMFTTVYKRVHVNNDKGLEEFNKVAIPMREGSKLVSIIARAISKDNKITLLDQDNIKEVKNLSNLGSYKIFAIEGLEIGGEIEYLYTVKSPVLYSNNEVFQTNVKVKKAVFKIFFPEKIIVETRSYNGFTDLKFSKNSYNTLSMLSGEVVDIAAHNKSEYETYEANLMKVEYVIKRVKNQFGSLEDAYCWRNVVKSQNNYIFNVKGDSKVASLLRDLKVTDLPNANQQIMAIEKFVKNNIKYKRSNSPELSDIKKIIKNKYANELGLTRLYAKCFTLSNIKFRLMTTSNRYYDLFDKEFASNGSQTHYVYYFPGIDQYISPISFEYRLGMAPYIYESNDGLLIDTKDFSDVSFHKIKTADTSMNYINRLINIEFPNIQDHVIVNGVTSFNGHRAIRLRGNLFFNTDKENDELIKTLASSEDPDAEILETQFTNKDLDESFTKNDLVFSYKKKSKSIIEKANENILFNIGKVIGKQTELYQDTLRTVPIDMANPIQYNYTIKFTVPEGYTVKNPEDLKINQVLVEGDKSTAHFCSNYMINNKDILVTISECYIKSHYEISTYQEFRKVINAASDFGKIVLVLEKKQNTSTNN